MIIKKILILIATILISTSFVSASQVITKQDNQIKYKSSYIVSYHRNVQGCLEGDIQKINIPKPKYIKSIEVNNYGPIKTCNYKLNDFNMPYSTTPKSYKNKITTYEMGCY